MKKNTMGIQFVMLLLMLLLAGQSSWAGSWRIDRYEYERYLERVEYYASPSQKFSGRYNIDDWNLKPTVESGVLSASEGGYLSYPDFYSGGDVILNRASANNIGFALKLKVTPVYKWIGEVGETPRSEFWVRESGHLNLSRSHYAGDGIHDAQNPYTGGNFLVVTATDGFNDVPIGAPTDYYGDIYSASRSWDQCQSFRFSSNVDKLTVAPGETEVRGKTRNITARVAFNGSAGDVSNSWGFWARAWYLTEVVSFSLDVAGDIVKDLSKHPRSKHLWAYAYPNWQFAWDGAPSQFEERNFWDGQAGYNANISPNLMSTIGGNPTYEWTQSGTLASPYSLSGEIYYNPLVTGVTHPDKDINASTPSKIFHHDLGPEDNNLSSQDWPAETVTSVKVTGNNEQESTLTAKARIEWSAGPQTLYRVRVKNTYVNLETGHVVEATASVEDTDPADKFAYEVSQAKKDTFTKFDQVVGTPLRVGEFAYVSAYEILAPDAYDLVIPVAGGAAKRVYKAVKGIPKFVEFATKVGTKLGSKADEIDSVARTALGAASHEQVAARTQMIQERILRYGKLPDGSERADEVLDVVQTGVKFSKTACFTAGTLVAMSDGTHKPIEKIRAGDFVWSKSESTGDIAPKRVKQVSIKNGFSTLILTFSNGERIEATADHPFFVEHKGFVNAGLLAVGNSVITRAGPNVTVERIEQKNVLTTVYNFAVEDFQTYFVGKTGIWVHNSICPAAGAAAEAADEIVAEWLGKYKPQPGKRKPDLPGMVAAIEFPGIITVRGYSHNKNWDAVTDYAMPEWQENPLVTALYDAAVPTGRAENHAKCAEAMALGVLFDHLNLNVGPETENLVDVIKSHIPPGSKSEARRPGRPDNPIAACASCEKLFDALGITFLRAW